jgi:Predicted acyl-CoA transferases/carnitine dehydratase
MSTIETDPTLRDGPCAGIRVIDLTSLVSGPQGTQVLADLGAEVIRVESPGSDPLRFTSPLNKGLGAWFAQINRGKKSISVDLKSDEGKKAILKLVESADIFIQNSRPGVMERLGFGYEQLRTINDRLIYISITGFGETGAFADRPAYDTVIQGLIGFMPIQAGHGGNGAIRSPVADKATAVWAANAALAALLDRERSDGKGQKVVLDMVSAYAAWALTDVLNREAFPGSEVDPGNDRWSPYSTLETADGSVIGLILQPSQFARLAKALGRPDLIEDPRLSTPMGLMENGEIFYEAFAPIVRKMTTKAFLDMMDELSVPFGRVNTIEEFVASPEAASAGVFVEVDDPEYGKIRHVDYPAKFERSRATVRGRAPKLGEHNDEFLIGTD